MRRSQTTAPPQIPCAELSDITWDAVIIGAGPAGATLAAHLARRRYHVLLLDRQVFPRDKVCGDGLLPDAQGCLQRLGVLQTVQARAHPVRELSLWSPSQYQVDIPVTAFTLRRAILDQVLVNQAVADGAVFALGQAISLRHEAGNRLAITLSGENRLITTRTAAIATGARWKDKPAYDSPGPMAVPEAVAMRAYLRSTHTIDRMVLSYSRSILPGYAWIFPLGQGRYNVGCGLFRNDPRANREHSLQSLFRQFLGDFPPVSALLREGQLESPIRGAPLRCGLHAAAPPYGLPLVHIGEAHATTLPMTGEGIGRAMRSAEIAADALDEALVHDEPERLSSYPARLRDELELGYRGYARAQRWLQQPWVCDLLIRRARHSPYLRKAASRILQEEMNPGLLFSLRGILPAAIG